MSCEQTGQELDKIKTLTERCDPSVAATVKLELVLEVECVQLTMSPHHQQAAGHIVITWAPGNLLQEPHPCVAVLLPGVGAHQVILASPDLVQPDNKSHSKSDHSRQSDAHSSYLGVDLSLV